MLHIILHIIYYIVLQYYYYIIINIYVLHILLLIYMYYILYCILSNKIFSASVYFAEILKVIKQSIIHHIDASQCSMRQYLASITC